MEEMTKHGSIGRAAMHADMDRKTARKYVTAGKLPSELKQHRRWRTRTDAFVEVWPAITAALTALCQPCPELDLVYFLQTEAAAP